MSVRTLIERPFNIFELRKTTYHHIVSAFLIAHTHTLSRFQKQSLGSRLQQKVPSKKSGGESEQKRDRARQSERQRGRDMSGGLKRLVPLLDRVLVERVAPLQKSVGGVILPDSAVSKVRHGSIPLSRGADLSTLATNSPRFV